MARTRALLTQTEREHLQSEDGSKRYQTVSRVRNRINEELEADVEILKSNHPELFEELQTAVCERDE